MSATTIGEQKKAVLDFAVEAAKSASSIYCVWDDERMQFTADIPRNVRANFDKIEKLMDEQMITVSDLFLIKAVYFLGYASADHVFSLIRYWARCSHESFLRGEVPEELALPKFSQVSDCFFRLSALVKHGVLTMYRFVPEFRRTDRSKTGAEYLFRAIGNMILVCRKQLSIREPSFEPEENILGTPDIFARCLVSDAVSAFAASRFVKKIDYRVRGIVGKRRNRADVRFVFNPKGVTGDDSEDTGVYMIGVTFHTNPAIVLPEDRRVDMEKKIIEALELTASGGLTPDACLIIICEDLAGLAQTARIVYENGSQMGVLDKVLLTTGNVLHDGDVYERPSRLRNCFFNIEPVRTDDGVETGFQLDGAVGFYFLEIDDGDTLKKRK